MQRRRCLGSEPWERGATAAGPTRRAISQIGAACKCECCSSFGRRAKFRRTREDFKNSRAFMAKIEDRAPKSKKAAPSLNDDIGEELRLRMFRMQVVLREAEQRAF